jgi:hypothetical protein
MFGHHGNQGKHDHGNHGKRDEQVSDEISPAASYRPS